MKGYILLLASWIAWISAAGQTSINEGAILRIRARAEGAPSSYGDPHGIHAIFDEFINEYRYPVQGTGFVIVRKGQYYLLTNLHVVEHNTKDLWAFDSNNKAYKIQLVGADTFYDLAVFSFVKTYPKFPRLTLSMTDPTVGLSALSIGYPDSTKKLLRKESKVEGVEVHTESRDIRSQIGYIAHSKMLAHGYSGSPLLNQQTGEVIGMNTRRGGESTYSISAKLLSRLVEDICTYRKVKRAWLGIACVDEYQTCDQLPIVAHIFPDSPFAEKLFSYKGWAIESINGQATYSLKHLLAISETLRPDTAISIGLKKVEGDNLWQKTFLITPRELKAEHYKAIALYFFKKYKGLTLTGTSQGILMKQVGNTTVDSSLPGITYIIGAGTDPSADNPQLFRASNLRELGIITRLCLLWKGTLHISTYHKTQSGDEKRLQKALYTPNQHCILFN